jgi:hypothetical protein
MALAALAGLGIAKLPDFPTDPHVTTGALVPVITVYKGTGGRFVRRGRDAIMYRAKSESLISILIETFSSAASRVNAEVSP